MKTERMPWTCRWSEFKPASDAPMWMDAWLTQWVCLAEHRKGGEGEIGRCADCQKYEPREEGAPEPVQLARP